MSDLVNPRLTKMTHVGAYQSIIGKSIHKQHTHSKPGACEEFHNRLLELTHLHAYLSNIGEMHTYTHTHSKPGVCEKFHTRKRTCCTAGVKGATTRL